MEKCLREGGMREEGMFAGMIGCMWKEQRVPEDGEEPGRQRRGKGKEGDLTD